MSWWAEELKVVIVICRRKAAVNCGGSRHRSPLNLLNLSRPKGAEPFEPGPAKQALLLCALEYFL